MIRIGVRCWWHRHRPCLEWLCFQGSAQRLVPASCPSEHKWWHLRCPGRKPKAPLSDPCATVNTFNGIFIVIISHNISYIDSPWFTIVVIWSHHFPQVTSMDICGSALPKLHVPTIGSDFPTPYSCCVHVHRSYLGESELSITKLNPKSSKINWLLSIAK